MKGRAVSPTLGKAATQPANAGPCAKRGLWVYSAAAGIVALAAITASATAVSAAPAIRTSATNRVPTCVTPEKLTRFLEQRNGRLLPRFRRIAHEYKWHGERWRVRWDYAFYQMALETNFLTFRKGNGRPGDVSPKQNNFAGIGTTGGGVPGNSFPDVSTGVLAQIQHLVAYSGERLAAPVAPRTRLKQDDIISGSRRVSQRRPVTFQDLSGRWAVDRRYGRSIEVIARLFRERFCTGDDSRDVATAPAPKKSTPVRSKRRTPAPAGTSRVAGAPVELCQIRVAGQGGQRALLIRSREGTTLNLTALDVIPGREQEMARRFIAAYASGGEPIGAYPSRDTAVKVARAMCDRATGTGKQASRP